MFSILTLLKWTVETPRSKKLFVNSGNLQDINIFPLSEMHSSPTFTQSIKK
jgi:hypothetical protein